MDAAQTNSQKTTFFLAAALLLIAPVEALAQPTLSASPTTVTIGNSLSCNSSQAVFVTSSNGSTIPFKVAVNYSAGDPNGAWAYATISGVGTTSTGTTFTGSTNTAGVTLTVGLNRSIGSATDTAQVVLTDTTNAADTVTITVFYVENTSCGGNTGSASNGTSLTVTPGNIALSSSQTTQTMSVQNLTGSSLTYGFSVSPSNLWLSATANSVTIPANGTVSINVSGDPTQVSSTGTYNGVLTITPQAGFGTALNIQVTFTVTSTTGGGGGGNTNSSTLTLGTGGTSSVYNYSFMYVNPNIPGSFCVPIQDTVAGINTYSFQVSTASGGNWLVANNNYNGSGVESGLIAPGSNACVTISMNANSGGLASGVYQGSVALTSGSGATATINAYLYVSGGQASGVAVSPNVIYSFSNVALNSNVVQQQQFTITPASGVSLGTASPQSGTGSWFSMTTPTGNANGSETFTVTANSSSLGAGVYAAVITLQSSPSSVTTYITVILPVGQPGATTNGNGGGNTVNSSVAPLSLAFQEQQGSSLWTGGQEAQAITITGQQGTQWSASIVYGSGSGWLTFDSPVGGSGTFGSGPATLMVDLYNATSSLAASATPYAATVAITTPSGTYNVGVSLLVTPGNVPVLLSKPASVTLSASGGVNPTSQALVVVGSDNFSSSTSPPITAGTPTASWITASTSGNSVTIGASVSGLSTGVYSGTVPISATAYANAINIPVVLIINGGGNGTTSNGPLTFTPNPVSFTNVTGQTSQNLNVTASTSTNFTVTAAESSCIGSLWLSVATGTYVASNVSASVNVIVNPSGVANGTTCSGLITLSSASATQTVGVSMTVGTAGAGGNVTVSPTSMPFSFIQGGSTPTAQTATIVNAISGTASIPFSVNVAESSGTSTAWLQVNTTSASTPFNSPGLSVSVAPGNLGPGTYQGTVTIQPNGGNAQVISVTLTVSSSAVVSATPTTLSLSYTVGGASPNATIAVSGGGAAAAFTATAASSAGWLQVSPTSGNTPNTGTFNLTASVNPSVLGTLLPSGSPYSGTVTVSGTSPATGTTIVNLTLTVTAPLPVISSVYNAASEANGGAAGAVSPGEIIEIFAPSSGPIGPGVGVALGSSNCPNPCTSLPTTMGGVQVKFLPGGVLAPLTYVSSGQINAVVPYQEANLTNISVEVLYLGQTSNAYSLTVAPTTLGVFTANASGSGPVAANQYDNNGNYRGQNTINAPATGGAGWYLALYMTGEGVVTPAATTGAVTSTSPPPVPLFAPTVRINNLPATVLAYGEAPGLVSGVLQVNVLIPAGAGTGAVPISVSLGNSSSQTGLTVFLQ